MVKPIRAWAVVCKSNKIHWHMNIIPHPTLVSQADTTDTCGPHRIAELVEKPKKRRK